MDLRIEATPGELQDKADNLIEGLIKAVEHIAPDLANRLEKALPTKEPELKFKALRDLKEKTDAGYAQMLAAMQKDIDKVLDRSIFASLKKSGPIATGKRGGKIYGYDNKGKPIYTPTKTTKVTPEEKMILDHHGLGGFVEGKPTALYHGTTAAFTSFDMAQSRDELVDRFYGKGIFLTPSKDVARSYAEANRNMGLPASIIDDLSKTNKNAAALLRSMHTHGYSEGWEKYMEDAGVEWKDLDAHLGGVDGDDLGSIVESIIGSKQVKDTSGGPVNIFSQSTGLDEHVYSRLDAVGIDSRKYRPKVYKTTVQASNVLVTKSKSAASKARAKGYDGVVFLGDDLVDGIPEVAVFDAKKTKVEGVKVVGWKPDPGGEIGTSVESEESYEVPTEAPSRGDLSALPKEISARIVKTMDAVGKRFPELADVRVELSEWMRGTDVLASKSHSALGLNPDQWTDPKKLAAHEKEWKGMLVDPSIEGVVIHEMGHVLANRVMRSIGADAYNEIQKRHFKDLNSIGSTEATSVYGQENTSEFEAESFVALYHDRAEMGPFSDEALKFGKAYWAEMLGAIRKETSKIQKAFADHTEYIHDIDDKKYMRIKAVLMQRGYVEEDFKEGGPLYGYSVNQLLEMTKARA